MLRTLCLPYPKNTDPNKKELLEWETRIRIIEVIAQGLLYLHYYTRLRIIHRDLKASYIYWMVKWTPRYLILAWRGYLAVTSHKPTQSTLLEHSKLKLKKIFYDNHGKRYGWIRVLLIAKMENDWKTTNSNEKFGNERSDLVRFSVSFFIFHGIHFFGQWVRKFFHIKNVKRWRTTHQIIHLFL